jgi:hypothetical protein
MIWTPEGFATGLPNERTVHRLPPEYMQMLAVFAHTSSDIDAGIHCSRCKHDIVGKNASADNAWRMECECRTFIGANPIKSH